ncbi:MAG: 2Fe-2S iron-sulfur cluster-binding protein [Acetobacteraceae bacterium]
MSGTHRIAVTVNGTICRDTVEDRLLLVDFLRVNLGLTGTHAGCEHGVCGACTVLLDGISVRSCLTLAVQADGAAVETVEGLGTTGALGPLQQAFRAHHALQCGFCTPGFLMTCTDLLRTRALASEADIRDALGGNLCRCTGYQNIVRAVQAAVAQRGPLQAGSPPEGHPPERHPPEGHPPEGNLPKENQPVDNRPAGNPPKGDHP